MVCATFVAAPQSEIQANVVPFPFCLVLHTSCSPNDNCVCDCPELSRRSCVGRSQSQVLRLGSDRLLYDFFDVPFYNDTSNSPNTETLRYLVLRTTTSSSAVLRAPLHVTFYKS